MDKNFDAAAYKAMHAQVDDLTQKATQLNAMGEHRDAAILSQQASILIIQSRLKVIEDYLGISEWELPSHLL